MKAIIKIPTKKNRGAGEPASSTYSRCEYIFLAVKAGAERVVDDRVLWVIGELGGFGYPARDARLMAEALECGHEHLAGRNSRHLVLSCEANLREDQRTVAFARLKASAPLLARALGAIRWIAVAHDDKDHPHIHLIILNYDPVEDKRLDIRPTVLSRLQDMDWTPHFDAGKGSRKEPRSKRGKAVKKAREEGAKRLIQEKAPVIRKLKKFLKVNNVPKMEPAALADWLAEAELPPGWKKQKLRTPSGGRRTDPAIIIDGVGLKFSRYFETQQKARQIHKSKVVMDKNNGLSR